MNLLFRLSNWFGRMFRISPLTVLVMFVAILFATTPVFAKGHHRSKNVKHAAAAVTETAQAETSTLAVQRDYDEAYQTANWSAVQKAWKQYKADVVAYKETEGTAWTDEAVAKASADAPTTPCAAWPYINLANHIWNEGQASSDEYAAAMAKAKEIIGDFAGADADRIREIIYRHDGPNGVNPASVKEAAEETPEENAENTN